MSFENPSFDNPEETKSEAVRAKELQELKLKGEEAGVEERNAEWSENAKKVEAAKAEAVAKSIEDGTYEYDGNVSHEENMRRMRAAEAGVEERNAEWTENAKKVEAANTEKSASEAAAAEARNTEWSENAKKVEAAKAEAVAKSIEDGTYEYDGNVSHEENMRRMRAAEAGVAKRNEKWKKAA